MRRLEFQTEALGDFRKIARYIAEHGDRATANAFIARLRARCDRLAEIPGTLGTARPDLASDLRSTPHQGYIIYFRYTDDAVQIVNVLDARRDMLAHFAPDGPDA